ncbi:hypothetical protein ACHHYP_15167 [Achlya hypogyna]|uniref:TBC1 domain family member 31 n=1 Tax=Achlya hypogyna TaxID=1202772 RepID=A0A1V9YBG3_ACHHY|nr:hypothetical protein ACHHYP_15167 [Achlya hypogyna]
MVYEVRLKLGTDEEGVLWPRRPQVGASGLLGHLRNLPLRSTKEDEAARFRCVAFSATGDVFAGVDEKGRVFAFFPTRNRYALVCHLGTPVVACAFSPQQRAELLVTCEDGSVRCVNVATKALVSTLRGHRQVPSCVSFQRPGQLALTSSRDAVILWDSADWTRFRTLNAGPGVEAAQFVGHGELVAVCFCDDSILMWELSSLALQYQFRLPDYEHPPGLKRFCVSDSCRAVIASGQSPFIYVWEFESQTLIRIIELPATVRRVVQHAFVPCTSTIISVLGDDGQLNFLNVSTPQPKVSLQIAHRAKAMTAFAMDAAGKYLVAATSDGCILLYDLDIARETASMVQGVRQRADIDEHYLPTRSSIASAPLMDALFGTAAKRPVVPPTPMPPTPTTPTTPPTPMPPAPPVAPVGGLSFADKKDVALQKRRLAQLLRSYELFPERYRMLAWRYLLELPDNADAFGALLAKGVHPAFLRLERQYPIQNQRLFRRLQRLLSAVAFWCPALGEVDYLPGLVFPFVKVCDNNDVMAFEVVATLLLHWGRDFLVRYPYPPLHVLRVLEKELERRDPQLFLHFVAHGVPAETFAWSLVASAFSQVLSRRDWLCLWDNLVTAFETPGKLWAAVLAFLQLSRGALLELATAAAIGAFFTQQHALDMRQLVDWMEQMEVPLPAPEDPPLVPLPKGSYPPFRHYPTFVVDYQIQERNRIARDEEELAAKQALLAKLQAQSAALDEAHQAWMAQKQHWLQGEQQRRLEAIEREKQRVVEMKLLHAQTRDRRLQQIIAMEQHAKEALEQTSQLVAAEHERYRTELELSAQKQAARARHLADDEEVAALEAAARARVDRLAQERLVEERLQQMRVDFVAQCRQQELADQRVFDAWQAQDREAAAEATAQLQRRQEAARQAQEDALAGEWRQKMQLHQIERERTLQALAQARDDRRRQPPPQSPRSSHKGSAGNRQASAGDRLVSSASTDEPPEADLWRASATSWDDALGIPQSSDRSASLASVPAPRPTSRSSPPPTTSPPPQDVDTSRQPHPAPSMATAPVDSHRQPSPVPLMDPPPQIIESHRRASPAPSESATTPVVDRPSQPTLSLSAPQPALASVPPSASVDAPSIKTKPVANALRSDVPSVSSVLPPAPVAIAPVATAPAEAAREAVRELLGQGPAPATSPQSSVSSTHERMLLRRALALVSSDEESDGGGLFAPPPLPNHRLSALEHELELEFSALGSDADSLDQRPLSDLERDLEGMFSDDDEDSSASLSQLEALLRPSPTSSAPTPMPPTPMDVGVVAVGDAADLVAKPTAPYERDDNHERLMARAKALLREHQYRTA